MKNRLALVGTGLALAATAAVPAHAENYSAITSAVDWSTAITALGVVGAAIALVLVARKGIKAVLGMIR
jgi:hypothetical protein